MRSEFVLAACRFSERQFLGSQRTIREYSRLPHIVAVILVCITFPLIWVGGLVTTYDAGMAVPDLANHLGYNMFLYPISTWVSGPWDLFIEHGHRLLGSLAGLLTIALNVAIWRYDDRRWMRTVGAVALLLVVSQGLLGGMRVRMNSTDFARAHGMHRAFVLCDLRFDLRDDFSVLAARCSRVGEFQGSNRNWVLSGWLLAGLAYLQLVLGAHLRHPGVTCVSDAVSRLCVVPCFACDFPAFCGCSSSVGGDEISQAVARTNDVADEFGVRTGPAGCCYLASQIWLANVPAIGIGKLC